MSERINISFEDEKSSGEKIIIDLPEEKPEKQMISRSVALLTSKGDSGLSMFYNSSLSFPTGIDSGFRIKYSKNLKDKFLNRILFNDKIVLLASSSGKLYFIDLDSGTIVNELIFEGEVFEKTGVVLQNDFYVNSVSSIFKINSKSEHLDNNSTHQIYTVSEGYFIWSDLNTNGQDIFFIEYNPSQKKSNLIHLNPENGHVIFKQEFEMNQPELSDICICKDNLIFICNDGLRVWNISSMSFIDIMNSPKVNKFSVLCTFDSRLYIYSTDNMIYFSDTLSDFKPTGVSRVLVNSFGAFEKYILLSKSNGWEIALESGSSIFTHEDIEVNFLQAISKNIFCFSNKNKLLLYNPEKFTEAEGIAIKSDDNSEPQEIIASAISNDIILCLTKNGILTGITNDKLNINV